MTALRSGLLTRHVAALLALLWFALPSPAQPASSGPWPANRLWSVHLLDDPPIFDAGDDVGRLQALPRWTGDNYAADVRILAPDGTEAHTVTLETLAHPLDWSAPAGGDGLYTVEATVSDPDGNTRVFTSPLIVGSITSAKEALGARSKRLPVDPSDPLVGAALRFAQTWCNAPLRRITRREAELLLQVRTSLDLVENDALRSASRRAVPATIRNAKAPSLASRNTRFWWLLPDDYETRDDWPLVVFLHGSEGRAPEMTRALYNPVRTAIERGDDIPAVVLIPKCDGTRHWSPSVLDGLVDWATDTFTIDPERVSATGLSLGGKGAWEWAMASPERLSAIAPFAGNANPLATQKIRHLPVWNTHGRRDRLVDFYLSANLVDLLTRFGGDVRFDIVHEGGHSVWDQTYASAEFWTWLLSHRRTTPASDPILTFDLANLSEFTVETVPETAYVGIELPHDWESQEPQENARSVGPVYQRVYDVPGLTVTGPHTLEANATGTTFLGVLLGSEDDGASGGLDLALDVERVERRTVSGTVVSAFYNGPRDGCAAAFDVLEARAKTAGHTPTGRRLTRVWWDDWHDGSGFRELWLFVE